MMGAGVSVQLGNNGSVNQTSPVSVSGLTNAKSISGGSSHACAVTTSGVARCWGLNSGGQIGDKTTTIRRVPTTPDGLSSGVASISAGMDQSCAITTGGQIKCWGANPGHNLGDGTNVGRSSPVDATVFGTLAVKSIHTSKFNGWASGSYPHHTCAHLETDEVVCIGRNIGGQFGNGTTLNALTVPVYVGGS